MGPSLVWPPFCFLLKFCLCYMFYSSKSFALAFCFALVFFVACSFLVICFTSLNSSCIVVQLLLHYCFVFLACYSTNIVIWLYVFNFFLSSSTFLTQLPCMFSFSYIIVWLCLHCCCYFGIPLPAHPHLFCVGLRKRNLKLLNCVASSIFSSTNYNLKPYTFVFSYPLFQFFVCNHS